MAFRYEKPPIDKSSTSVVGSNYSKGKLVRQQTGSYFLRNTQLLDEDQTQFYLVRASHGYQLKDLETLPPGTANINLQRFVFAVPGFLVSANTQVRHAKTYQKGESSRGNSRACSTHRVLQYSYGNR